MYKNTDNEPQLDTHCTKLMSDVFPVLNQHIGSTVNQEINRATTQGDIDGKTYWNTYNQSYKPSLMKNRLVDDITEITDNVEYLGGTHALLNQEN